MPKRSRNGSSVRRVRRRVRRPIRRARKRNLRQSYRRINLYRFKREILPSTVSATVIPASGGYGAMGYFQFKDLTASMMVNFVSEFGNLFASYHIDCVVTTLTPLWEGTAAVNSDSTVAAEGTYTNWLEVSPQCIATRVNGKFLNSPLTIQANAQAQREVLAQLQAKKRSRMLRRRPIKLVTKNPCVYSHILEDPDNPANNEIIREKQPWMNITNQSQVELAHNDTIFIERVDGRDVTTDWKFRVQHTFYFRTGFVG